MRDWLWYSVNWSANRSWRAAALRELRPTEYLTSGLSLDWIAVVTGSFATVHVTAPVTPMQSTSTEAVSTSVRLRSFMKATKRRAIGRESRAVLEPAKSIAAPSTA